MYYLNRLNIVLWTVFLSIGMIGRLLGVTNFGAIMSGITDYLVLWAAGIFAWAIITDQVDIKFKWKSRKEKD